MARNPRGLTRSEVVTKATSSRHKADRKGIAPALREALAALVESGEVGTVDLHHRGVCYFLTTA